MGDNMLLDQVNRIEKYLHTAECGVQYSIITKQQVQCHVIYTRTDA